MTQETSGAGRRVLVVDDEPLMRGVIKRLLGIEGYEVLEAEDGAEALEVVRKEAADIVLLDVNLPTRDGLDILGDLRAVSDVPVIVVSARGEETDRVIGLKLGADDYVVKPFSAAELSARVASVLRRARPSPAAPPVQPPPPPATAASKRLDVGGVSLDFGTREVFVEGRLVDTTAKEFDLLAFMAASPRQVFSRQQLLEHVWGSSSEWQQEATVTEHVRRLRRKLETDPDNPRWVTTVRGVGYRFEP